MMNTTLEIRISKDEKEALLPIIPKGMHYDLHRASIQYSFSTTKDNMEDLLDILAGISPRVITFDEICLRNKVTKSID